MSESNAKNIAIKNCRYRRLMFFVQAVLDSLNSKTLIYPITRQQKDTRQCTIACNTFIYY